MTMKSWLLVVSALAGTAASIAVLGATATRGDSIEDAGASAQWTTVFRSPLPLEGLTGDDDGNLYVVQRGGGANPCPILRIHPPNGTPTLVGTVPAPCGPSGLTFDADGKLYVTGAGSSGDAIVVLTPSAASPPTTATTFATGVPGANGIAFDDQGALWATDGTTAQGRVWKVPPGGGAGVEMFRVPTMAAPNGVGRQAQTLQPAPAPPNTQGIVANGIEFSKDGDEVFVADTARGAIWEVGLDAKREVEDQLDCDPVYPAKTLCPDSLFAQNPLLEGGDGLVLDKSGNIWVAANERNAIVVVERKGRVVQFFRNPPDATTGLRNGGPLELPTSPLFLEHLFCVTQSDGNRRDNSPNTAGEAAPGTAFVAKVSCLQEPLPVKGAPLPVG
jgi:sugar lactone lactonase YvrE